MPEGTKPLLESHGSQTRFDMSKNMENQDKKRKRVLVVGAGAAGESSARLITITTMVHGVATNISIQACPVRTIFPTTPTNSM